MARPDQMQTARAEPIRYTYEDYLSFPDDGRRHELSREEGHSLDTPLLPGFLLSLAELFA